MTDNVLSMKIMLHMILFIVLHARRVRRRPPKTTTIQYPGVRRISQRSDNHAVR